MEREERNPACQHLGGGSDFEGERGEDGGGEGGEDEDGGEDKGKGSVEIEPC